MLAEPQRICFERAERPSIVKGDRGEEMYLDEKCHNRFKNRPNSFASLGEAECFITTV